MWGKHLRKILPRITSNWWFVTVTASRTKRSEAASLENLRKGLDSLMKRIKRVWSNVEYVRVYEKHKKGGFHAHLVVSGLSARVQKFATSAGVPYFRPSLLEHGLGNWSVRTWFSKNASALKMGYMVDVQPLEGVSAAIGYLIKYLTKAAQDFNFKGLRRIQTSRAVGSPRTAGDETWRCAPVVFRHNLQEGASLYDASLKLWVPAEYWRENLTYPKPNSNAP